MPVRIAVVGAGTFGQTHLDVFTQLGDSGVELAAIAEANPARAEALRARYRIPVYADHREMLEKAPLDAVSVATPDHLHRGIVIDAAAAGKHILVEKPLDVTVEGAEAMVRAARGAGVLLQVDFHKRYDPDHQAIERRVRSGELGDILYGSVHMEDRIEVPAEWFPHWAASSSPAWFLGVHFYDLVRWILKSEATTVYATGTKASLARDHGIDTYDCVNAKVDFANGAAFAFDTSWILPKEFEAVVNQGLRIVGTKGFFECDSQDRGTRSCIGGEGMATYNNNFKREIVDRRGRRLLRGYGIESIEDFAMNVAFLKDGGRLADLGGIWASGEDGLETTRIAVAVHESLAGGRVVRLR
ncbi:MAG TPA: Gfo/Idh/MocA family oxidoreductase [Acidobacteriota bacterium]|nr:Gfo/Idh/MocA family oxidoreductase [Acidobacteriota bacterium]